MKNVSTKIAYMVIGSLLTMWATLTFIPGCGIHHSEPIKINVRNTKTNESQTSSKSILDELDKRLYKEGGMLYKKGDTLPPFDSDDIVKDGGEIHIVNRNNKVGGARIVGEFPPNASFIRFIGEGAWIELSNGTRYTCKTEKCIIDMETHTISEGKLLKSMSKDNQ